MLFTINCKFRHVHQPWPITSMSLPPFPESTQSSSFMLYLKMRFRSKNTSLILNSSWHFLPDPYTLSSTLLPSTPPCLYSSHRDTKSLPSLLICRWGVYVFFSSILPLSMSALNPPVLLPFEGSNKRNLEKKKKKHVLFTSSLFSQLHFANIL